MQRDLQPVTSYPLNEVFESMQGEASFTGTPSLFIRLQGCDVGCPWCDTKHTWERDEAARVEPFAVFYVKDEHPSSAWSWVSAIVLADIAEASLAHHAVITGGEPCQFDLVPLIEAIERRRMRVQVETSGTYVPRVTEHTFLTVSPKFDMPGGRKVEPAALERADEFKCVVGKAHDIDIVCERIAPVARDYHTPIWLQPVSGSAKATALCLQAAFDHGWRVSLQTHKFANLR